MKKNISVVSLIAFLIIFLAILDICFERNFIRSAKLLVGQDEKYIIQHYKKQYYRGKNISTLWRRRWLARFWGICGFDESVAVYLEMNKDKVEGVMFSMWIPSMEYKE